MERKDEMVETVDGGRVPRLALLGPYPRIKAVVCRARVPEFGCKVFVEQVRGHSAYQLHGAAMATQRGGEGVYPVAVWLYAPDQGAMHRALGYLRARFNPAHYTFGEPEITYYSGPEEELASLAAIALRPWGKRYQPSAVEPRHGDAVAFLAGHYLRDRLRLLRDVLGQEETMMERVEHAVALGAKTPAELRAHLLGESPSPEADAELGVALSTLMAQQRVTFLEARTQTDRIGIVWPPHGRG